MRVAERAIAELLEAATYVLQWGRNMRVAESRAPHRDGADRGPFNGAAT